MVYALAIPTNVKTHVTCNHAVQLCAGFDKSVIQIHSVPFGTKTRDIFGDLGDQFC